MKWDVFISHASEDKAAVARPLADILAANGVTSWLDEAELTLGDSLREKIDEGLNHSQFGVVILSPSFFSKRWPKSELDGLIARESDAPKVVLPVWHEVSFELVRGYSPILAGRLAVRTDDGLEKVAKAIMQAIGSVGRTRQTARPIFAGKLTKKALLGFPLGSILITNTVNPDLTPERIEELGGQVSREELWKSLRDASVPSLRVLVFENMAHLRIHLASRHDWLPDPTKPASPDEIALVGNMRNAPSPTLGEVKAFFHTLTREAHRRNDQVGASDNETWANEIRAQIEGALIGAKQYLFKTDFPRTFQGVRQWLFADSQNLREEHINPNFRIPRDTD